MKANLILFVGVALATLSTARAQTIINDLTTHANDQPIVDVGLPQIGGDWIVTAVERDGDTIRAQFGQQVGDVISLPNPLNEDAAMVVT